MERVPLDRNSYGTQETVVIFAAIAGLALFAPIAILYLTFLGLWVLTASLSIHYRHKSRVKPPKHSINMYLAIGLHILFTMFFGFVLLMDFS